jgi:hypothetical protein
MACPLSALNGLIVTDSSLPSLFESSQCRAQYSPASMSACVAFSDFIAVDEQ